MRALVRCALSASRRCSAGSAAFSAAAASASRRRLPALPPRGWVWCCLLLFF